MKSYVHIIMLIAAAGIGFGFVRPLWSGDVSNFSLLSIERNIAEQKSQIREYEAVLERANDLKAKRDELIEKRNSFTSDDQYTLDRIAPKKVDHLRMIVDLNQIAARHGLVLKDLTLNREGGQGETPSQRGVPATANQKEMAEKIVKLNIAFNVTGTYKNFRSFLTEVEQSLQIFDIGSLSVRPDVADILNISTTLVFYSTE